MGNENKLEPSEEQSIDVIVCFLSGRKEEFLNVEKIDIDYNFSKYHLTHKNGDKSLIGKDLVEYISIKKKVEININNLYDIEEFKRKN